MTHHYDCFNAGYLQGPGGTWDIDDKAQRTIQKILREATMEEKRNG
jgi:hypothetical protein